MNTQLNQSTIFVLVGLPGSGKSTWTKEFLSHTDEKYVTISTDDIIERMAVESGSTYNKVIHERYKDAEKEMKASARKAFADKVNVIWDQTNLGINKRKKIISQVPSGYLKVAVVFYIDEQELTNRLNRRVVETGKFISFKIIEQMRENFSEPSYSEGFDKIIIKRIT